MSAVKNVMKNNYRNMELDEYLSSTLKEAGYGGADVQKTPIGTRITLYVTRPGLVIGRKGVGIKDVTSKLESKFGLANPQISVMEVEVPELNPKIMCNRIAQLIERGTAFRRACLWTINTISNAGALGAEVTISGKLRSERAHFEKHAVGVLPKSGDVSDKVVKVGITHVLSKMGLMGIQLRIALKDQTPQEFEYTDEQPSAAAAGVTDEQPLPAKEQHSQQQPQQQSQQQEEPRQEVENATRMPRQEAESKQLRQQPKEEKAVPVGGSPNGQS
ncbi:MAG: 30S ribosomal protein S3 [Thermoproteota archaeon]|nr:30S ribosomal protein S3 [Thermoproteota archaeon]